MPVTGSFCRSAGGITFDDENFADGRVTAFTVGQFSVGVKGEFRLCEKISLGPFFGFSDFCCFLRTGEDIF